MQEKIRALFRSTRSLINFRHMSLLFSMTSLLFSYFKIYYGFKDHSFLRSSTITVEGGIANLSSTKRYFQQLNEDRCFKSSKPPSLYVFTRSASVTSYLICIALFILSFSLSQCSITQSMSTNSSLSSPNEQIKAQLFQLTWQSFHT